ncbi:MAG TPA: hypothetical protein VMW27_29090 [Thermoanaerobaculia bacterium]|nr:hypothetical protein [Thermoanaerobaculia bacterium]
MSEAQEPLTLARHCGRLEAERFDLDLRERERREREDRLTRLASGGDDTIFVSSAAPPRESSELFLRMQRDLEQLSAFQHAVVHSKAWKLIQAVRRPFGRAW